MKKQLFSALLIILLLFSAFNLPLPANAAFYNDTASHWAAGIIDTWSEYGIIQGSDELFRPNDYITRGDLALIIDRIMKYQRSSADTFRDLHTATEEQKAAILKLNAAGVMLGTDGYMRPNANISRQEAVVMIGRMMRISGSSTGAARYNDMNSIASWAVDIIRSMGDKGFVTGRANGDFEPSVNITRCEVVQIFDNIIKGFYSKSGVYTTSSMGNVVINATNVELKQVSITGDLYITEGVADGLVTLTDVSVEGNVYVMGGGPNSIRIQGRSNIGNIYHEKLSGNGVKYHITPPASVSNIYTRPGTVAIEIEGTLRSLSLNTINQNVKLTNAVINNISVNAEIIVISTNDNTSISNVTANYMVQILGKGQISEASVTASADGSTFERQPKKTYLPSGTTAFLGGQTYKNNTGYSQTINASEDNIAPVVAASSLSASNLTPNGATISWTASTDNITQAASLVYALYYSTSSNMRTVAEVEQNGIMATAFVANRLTGVVDGLQSGQIYYFNVIVKDQANNKSCYSAYSLRIGNDTAPPSLNSASISLSNIKKNEVTLNWNAASDAVTAQNKLKYSVYQSETNNIGSYSACEVNGKQIMNYAENVTTYTAKSLTENKTYYFNVVVMDEAGNKTSFSQVSITPTVDTTAPRITNANISVTNLTDKGARLSWSAATSASTSQEKLKYAVYYSIPANSLFEPLDEIADIEKATTLKAYTENLLYLDVTAPASGVYFYYVIVQDENGNKSKYGVRPISYGDDVTPPYFPTKKPADEYEPNEIVFTIQSGTSVRLNWQTALDLVTPQNELSYAVFYVQESQISSINQFNSYSDVERYAEWNGGYATNRLSQTISGLKANTAYYFNVLVKDKAGNIINYKPVRIVTTTTPPRISYTKVTPSETGTGSGFAFSLNWTQASHESTSQSDLMYAVYYSRGTEYKTISDIEKSAWSLVVPCNYQTAVSNAKLGNNDVLYGVKYYFYVLVKDSMGNTANYETLLYERKDTEPPVVPASNNAFDFSTAPGSKDGTYLVTLFWNEASDNVTVNKSDLVYSLFFTTSNDWYSTAAELSKNCTLLARGKGMTTYTHPDRPAGNSQYYLLVEDAAGNYEIYKRLSVHLP